LNLSLIELNQAMLKEVLPTTRQSYHQAAQVLARAFVDDPVSVACFRNFSPGRRVSALIVDFTAEELVCVRRGYPIQVNDDGKVIAAAVIYPPGSYPLPVVDLWLLLIKSILGNGLYDISPWLRWLAEVDQLHPKEAHYYLEYLGVEPEQQGKAVGSAILQHLINKADREHVGCYLENANQRNIPFYQRFGFQIMSEKEIIGIPSWFMWRPPDNC
jgi:ribosomal protein S18 acetylase RimI-like enzyme